MCELPAGETIPIRLFLGGFDLTPTFRDVNKRFSTRYYLNLVLIDEENRRYFKQQVRMRYSCSKCDVVTEGLVVTGDNYFPNTRGLFLLFLAIFDHTEMILEYRIDVTLYTIHLFVILSCGRLWH
jgi:hypothetical protein